MLLKVTEKCSMGCIHCLSDCKPEEKHMDMNTFKKGLEFWKGLRYDGLGNIIDYLNTPLIISGGEPFEHPDIKGFLEYIAKDYKDLSKFMTVTTNGDYLSTHPEDIEYYKEILPNLQFQVVIDDRYYPKHVDEKTLKQYSNIKVCHDVAAIYPMGRAVDNKLSHDRKSSQCFNLRALCKQTPRLYDAITQLTVKGKFCTPCIEYDGSIKVGESQLCPPCSHVDKTYDEIYEDIKKFKCSKCNFLNDKLPMMYRKFVM